MNNKSKPSACSAFGFRGAKVLPFLATDKIKCELFFQLSYAKLYVNQERFPASQIVFNSPFLWHKKVLIRHNPQ